MNRSRAVGADDSAVCRSGQGRKRFPIHLWYSRSIVRSQSCNTCGADAEADARAKMLIYLLESGLATS